MPQSGDLETLIQPKEYLYRTILITNTHYFSKQY